MDIFLMQGRMWRIPPILIGLQITIAYYLISQWHGREFVLELRFLKTTKKILDILKEIYDNKKNISMIFELYECFFTLQLGKLSVPTYYSTLFNTSWYLKRNGASPTSDSVWSKNPKRVLSRSYRRQVPFWSQLFLSDLSMRSNPY